MHKSARDIIKEKGGPAAFSRAMAAKGFPEFTPARVRVWKARDRFPKSAWAMIIATFKDVKLGTLSETESRDE